jgi:hypothetical protein
MLRPRKFTLTALTAMFVFAAVLALAAANFSTADASGSAHVLYGVTGDGATVRETLFTIDTSDASTTLVTPLGNGNDGSVTGTMVRRSPTNPTAA